MTLLEFFSGISSSFRNRRYEANIYFKQSDVLCAIPCRIHPSPPGSAQPGASASGNVVQFKLKLSIWMQPSLLSLTWIKLQTNESSALSRCCAVDSLHHIETAYFKACPCIEQNFILLEARHRLTGYRVPAYDHRTNSILEKVEETEPKLVVLHQSVTWNLHLVTFYSNKLSFISPPFQCPGIVFQPRQETVIGVLQKHRYRCMRMCRWEWFFHAEMRSVSS